MKSLNSKIEKFAKANTIPPILTALLNELEDEKSATKSIARLIVNDISLTARLLRSANSAFYNRQFEINTIDMAISVLGTKAVRALALSVSLFDITGGSISSNLIDFKIFWQHNLETAIISQILAQESKCCQPEEAFTCGLLHDLGLLFFIQECPDEYTAVLKIHSSGCRLETAEKEVFDMPHSDVGAAIALHWKLPRTICDSIANHHRIELTDISKQNCDIWHLVNLAHRFCRQGIDINTNPLPNEIETRHKLTQALGLEKQTMYRLLEDVPKKIVQAASFLDIDIGDPLILLQRANTELGKLYELYEKAKLENDNLQTKITQQEKSKIALEALRTTLATFSHYVNNANAAIIGRAQILGLYLDQGKLEDPESKIAESIKVICESVDVISAVLEELKEFPDYKTVTYHGNSRILDIDENIKARLGRLA